jgi:hypothetical protein
MHMLDYGHVKPESGVQEEQVSEVFEGPQATSCDDTNISFGSWQALVHLTNAFVFYFKTLLIVLH